MDLYPLKFRPWLRTMVWGGDKIAPFKGVCTEESNIGESWEISGVEGHISEVAEGPLLGKDIKGLIEEYKGALVGEKVYREKGTEFPLLIKFIDARSDLSIQVHPDDEMAARVHGKGSNGKTEMWYVVSADPGAFLLSGLNRQISPSEYVKMVEDNTITDVLARHTLSPGDVFFLPAGRIHAIGSGTFITEIQQTSDYTYRIYDYGRLGLDGKPRQLHTELAKEAIDYKVYPSYRTSYSPAKNTEIPLVSCPYFVTSLYDIDRPLCIDMSSLDSFLILICVEGSGEVSATIPGSQSPVPIHRGETVLIPACASSVSLSGTLKVLTSHL